MPMSRRNLMSNVAAAAAWPFAFACGSAGPFCAVQSPQVERLSQAQRARGLSVLALSIDRDPGAALNYIRQKNDGFPAGMLTREVARTMPKPRGLPVTVVRGRDGRVVLAQAGEMFPEDIEGIAKFL